MTMVEIIITECICVRALVCAVKPLHPFFLLLPVLYNKDLGCFIVLSRGRRL